MSPLTALAGLTINLSENLGSNDPGGANTSTNPWLSVKVVDLVSGSRDYVRITLDATGLVASEFVSDWLLSIDTTTFGESSGDFTFSTVSNPTSFSFPPSIGADDYQLSGPSGKFDLKFAFPTSNGGSSDRFKAGETVIFDLFYDDGANGNITSAAFIPNANTWISGAHVQGISEGSSAKIVGTYPVPEPNALFMMLTGVLGSFLLVRRR